jgi:Na+/H+ antiporter NhaD/arsenite permease-like protein
VFGLLIDWGVLHWLHFRSAAPWLDPIETIPLPALDLSRLTKPALVVTAVVASFFAGAPPATMAALGAAVLLITRSIEPQKFIGKWIGACLYFSLGFS